MSDEMPPLDLITSASALVLRDDAVLVSRNRDDTHIWPGGRREAGEILMQTLSREVFEETGWTIRDVTLLGFIHCHHETPKPMEYPYPYPDFIRVIYAAETEHFTPDTADPDEYEQESGFRPVDDVRAMVLRNGQHVYLAQALRLRRKRK
ncbi:MAG: NUDIX domain-containing protein [Thermomicrobia bacterium]|nr:NUDIX domain-containing protein [Thermomicrobia bacterium]